MSQRGTLILFLFFAKRGEKIADFDTKNGLLESLASHNKLLGWENVVSF